MGQGPLMLGDVLIETLKGPLHFGCGGGLLSESLARLGASVVGVDPTPRAIEAAKAHAAEVHRSLANRLVTEPPLTRKLSDAELHGYVLRPLRTEFLCHTQPCERGVKLTSDSCSKKSGYQTQLGIALMAERGRKENPVIRAIEL